MFDNIGGKIKSLAQITCWIGIVCSVIWGIVVWVEELGFWLGLGIIVLGSLGSWISAFTLYGFGQLIENSDYQKDYLKKLVDKEKEPIISKSFNFKRLLTILSIVIDFPYGKPFSLAMSFNHFRGQLKRYSLLLKS